ncbi:hypothetical protein [Terrabacter terrigena]|uniref:Uncharacterized protein n=1 Tax=Terrabacter terrigena TaxID=574718 RepID=A0ABW3MRT1_9MICO
MTLPPDSHAGSSPGTGPDAGTAPATGRVLATAPRAAAALVCVAGLVHLVVAPDHFDEWAPAGLFFIAVAAGQLWLAQALSRGLSARLVPAAVLLTSGLVALYVVSRTIGLPFHADGAGLGLGGSHHGGSQVPGGQGNGMPIIPGSGAEATIETVGALDLVCVVAELGALALLVGMLPPRQRRSVGNLLLAVGICGWVVWGLVRFT